MYFLTPANRVIVGMHLCGFVLSQGINLTTTFGLWEMGCSRFSPHQWITHAFLHNSLWDVGTHVLIMMGLGTALERTLGTWRFVVLYLFIALSTACVYSLFRHQAIAHVTGLYNAFMDSASPKTFIKYVNCFPEKMYQPCHTFYNAFLLDPDRSEHLSESKSIVSYLQASMVNTPRIGCSGMLWSILTAFSTLLPQARIALLMLFPVRAVYFVGAYIAFLTYQTLQGALLNQPERLSELAGMLAAFLFIKYAQRSFRL